MKTQRLRLRIIRQKVAIARQDNQSQAIRLLAAKAGDPIKGTIKTQATS